MSEFHMMPLKIDNFNHMNYLEFEKALKIFPVFSVKDIQKKFAGFDSRRLVEWQQKGYLLKIKRGYYSFTERNRGEHFLYFVANKIYSPSYISFESALAYYNLIPEGVFMMISATTKNTASYASSIGDFNYRHIKRSLFFGYKLLSENNFTIKIAEPEKVILDYFYINKINSFEEIEAIRFNEIVAKEIISFDKLKTYQKVFDSKILDRRMQMFIQIINA
jgi:predicted transcriptional regulator of viral defense system